MTRLRQPVLITGGAGFIGSNLADALLSDGQRVIVADTLSRPGVDRNAEWLAGRHGSRVEIERVDVADRDALRPLVERAGAVYHLAAQVAVTTSVEDPEEDLRANLLGTFNLLEIARSRPDPPPILFTSTNKVYGSLAGIPVESGERGYRFADGRSGVDEGTPLDFHSPYGCSKGAADQYVRDYARIYGIPTVVFRMSCIYGRRQWGNEDQGWVAHFARALLAGDAIRIFGDGHQVRDILWIDDLVDAMRRAMDRIGTTAGEVFNIGGGPGNAVSVLEVVHALAEILDRQVPLEMEPWRPGDQRIFVTDNTKLERALGWRPTTSSRAGLERLAAWLEEELAETGVRVATAAGR